MFVVFFRHPETALNVGIGKGVIFPAKEIIDGQSIRCIGGISRHRLPPALGVEMKIYGLCGFHIRSVPNDIGIPRHKPDVHPVSGESVHHLIAAPFETDGVIQVDSTTAFHEKKRLDVNGFRQWSANTSLVEPFLQW